MTKVRSVMNMTPMLKDKLVQRLATPVKPLSLQVRIVTPAEWKFVQELCAGDGAVTPKEAAIRAGWKPDQAGTAARRMTNPEKSPHVVAAIQEFRGELAAKYGTTFERHMRDLQRIRDAAMDAGNFGAAVTAEYRRGQALGTIYIERKEIRVGLIDSMSKEDVMRRLNEIQQIYGGSGVPAIAHGSIIDMSPEDIAVVKTPVPTIAEDMKNDERERRIVAETDRRERKRQHGRDLLTKIHGAARAAELRPDLFEGGGVRYGEHQDHPDDAGGADGGGDSVSHVDDSDGVSERHFSPDPSLGDDEDLGS